MKIQNIEQFDRLFRALALELTYANVHYQLFLDINGAFDEYKREINQSPAFWGITRDSIKHVASLGLCRVYDPDHRTNSLPNLLIEIRDNPNFLQIVMKGIETKSPAITIDTAQLLADIDFASVANPAVRRLIRWRSDIFVHKNAVRVADDIPLAIEHIPKYEDFELLLKEGLKIINRYAGDLRMTEYSTQLVGGDDFKYVLTSIRKSMEQYKKELHAEFEKTGLKPPG